MVMDAVERIGVSIRTQWGHHMAITYGPHGYLDEEHYTNVHRHRGRLDKLQDEFDRSRDAFAEHYHEKYCTPSLPPVWMATELMSFGLLSKFLGNLKLPADRKAIAQPVRSG